MQNNKFYNKLSITAFSLVELMLVVAISAGISAVAIPNYKNYINKAKVINMISLIDPCQTQIYQYYLKNGAFPDGSTSQPVTCQGITLSTSAKLLKDKIKAAYNQTSNECIFTVTHTDLHPSGAPTQLYPLQIKLTIDNTSGDISFSCRPGTSDPSMPPDYMPANCKQ